MGNDQRDPNVLHCFCRRAEEAAAAAEIARIEDEATAVNQKFSSLAEEAAEKSTKLAKLWKKYQVGWDPAQGAIHLLTGSLCGRKVASAHFCTVNCIVLRCETDLDPS